MEYFWNQKGIPHKGWTYVEVYDHLELYDEYFQCEMCGYERVRYVHILHHEEYGNISVGCVCAGKMVGNVEYAKEEEKRFKDTKNKRKAEFKRKKKEEERKRLEEEKNKKLEEERLQREENERKQREERYIKLEEERLQREENEKKRLEDLKVKRLAYLKSDLNNLEYSFNPRKNTYSARIHKEIVTIKLTVNGTYGYVFRNKWVWNLQTLGYAKQRVRDDLFNILKEECIYD